MKALLLFQQMLVLFAMMMTGFLAYRLAWVDRHGGQKVTTLVVKVFNPLMILSSVTGKRSGDAGSLMGQNLLLAVLYFVFVILCGYLYCFIRKLPRKDETRYQLLYLPLIWGLWAFRSSGLFSDRNTSSLSFSIF